jgi:arsenate reductase (glutaredoxin)
MPVIYHNPQCKKSREGLAYLKTKTASFRVREYLKDPLTTAEMDEIILKSGFKPAELVRKQEEVYKKELRGRNFTDDEWKRIILENPRLLVRPIVVGKYRAVLAQPAEKMEEVFGK